MGKIGKKEGVFILDRVRFGYLCVWVLVEVLFIRCKFLDKLNNFYEFYKRMVYKMRVIFLMTVLYGYYESLMKKIIVYVKTVFTEGIRK